MNYRRHQLNGVTQNQWCFNWTGFGKPYSIFDGFDGHEFQYDASHSRIVHTRLGDGTTGNRTDCTFVELEKRVYVGGAMEQFFTKSGSTWSAAKTRIYVSGPSGVIGVFNHDANATSAASNTASWLLKDHLGSVDTVLTMVGIQVQAQRYSYDAWGQRRDAATWAVQDPATISSTATDRGFTGHEMLDATGLVHMNGRIYDPLLGRFLSADPHVQSPQDLQSYNRYTYVNNNPVSFTDSTGFFIDKLFKKVGNFFKKFWKQIVVIVVVVVVAWVTAGLASKWVASWGGAFVTTGTTLSTLGAAAVGAIAGAAAGFAGGFLGSMLSGGSLGSALSAGFTGAMWGALSGAAAGAIGGHFGSNTQGFWTEVKRAAAHGLSSGVIDEVRGGAFLAGFAAGFFASGATHGLGIADWGIMSGGVMAAAIGGTAAVIGGGKFENGAIYGAFQFMFNAKGALRDKALEVEKVYDGDQIRITIKGRFWFVHYPDGRTLPADDPRVQEWVKGMESGWSGEKGNYILETQIDVVDTAKDSIRVVVYPGSGRPHMNQFFYESTSGVDAAHEFGHNLGLIDLYMNNNMTSVDPVYWANRTSSIMYYYNKTGVTEASEHDVRWMLDIHHP